MRIVPNRFIAFGERSTWFPPFSTSNPGGPGVFPRTLIHVPCELKVQTVIPELKPKLYTKRIIAKEQLELMLHAIYLHFRSMNPEGSATL